MSRRIRTAIVGLGNCASSLVQGVAYCRALGEAAIGVPLPVLGGWRPEDVEIVAAFDVDARKVGLDVSEAIFQAPNCTEIFHRDVPAAGVVVQRGPDLDGVSAFMRNQMPSRSFVLSDAPALEAAEIVATLRERGVDVLINFMPVGSQRAVEFWATCAMEAGCAMVNGIPVLIASDPKWSAKFRAAGVPVLGDDFKAQMGATIVHRTLSHLFDMRGVRMDRTYQLNVGGNTDFLNMMDHDRLQTKRLSKTEAVQTSMVHRLEDEQIRIGPSDYVPWLDDNKVAYVRLEGRLFGGVKMDIEARVSVEDSPNAAAMALIAIRLARIARDRGLAGDLGSAASFLFKHPPVQVDDEDGLARLIAFAEGAGTE
ncbi:MAG: inositol-3-phosphate synthase [Phyllobacteriaceae bacterium]|nr:inositol-3-phosphate synthase [Phyllobacteriaceae bacterium]